MTLHVEREQVVKITGNREHPSNFGRLCTKGSSAHIALRQSGRLEHAYVRAGRGQDPAPRPIADTLRDTARRLRAIIDAHGPDAVAQGMAAEEDPRPVQAQFLRIGQQDDQITLGRAARLDRPHGLQDGGHPG